MVYLNQTPTTQKERKLKSLNTAGIMLTGAIYKKDKNKNSMWILRFSSMQSMSKNIYAFNGRRPSLHGMQKEIHKRVYI